MKKKSPLWHVMVPASLCTKLGMSADEYVVLHKLVFLYDHTSLRLGKLIIAVKDISEATGYSENNLRSILANLKGKGLLVEYKNSYYRVSGYTIPSFSRALMDMEFCKKLYGDDLASEEFNEDIRNVMLGKANYGCVRSREGGTTKREKTTVSSVDYSNDTESGTNLARSIMKYHEITGSNNPGLPSESLIKNSFPENLKENSEENTEENANTTTSVESTPSNRFSGNPGLNAKLDALDEKYRCPLTYPSKTSNAAKDRCTRMYMLLGVKGKWPTNFGRSEIGMVQKIVEQWGNALLEPICQSVLDHPDKYQEACEQQGTCKSVFSLHSIHQWRMVYLQVYLELQHKPSVEKVKSRVRSAEDVLRDFGIDS